MTAPKWVSELFIDYALACRVNSYVTFLNKGKSNTPLLKLVHSAWWVWLVNFVVYCVLHLVFTESDFILHDSSCKFIFTVFHCVLLVSSIFAAEAASNCAVINVIQVFTLDIINWKVICETQFLNNIARWSAKNLSRPMFEDHNVWNTLSCTFSAIVIVNVNIRIILTKSSSSSVFYDIMSNSYD